jgi:CHRD domain
MQLLKLTVLSSLLFAVAISFTSCEKEAERNKVTEYIRTALPMTGAQENNPLNTSAALGSLDVYYSKAGKVLSYKFTWQGLTDTIIGIHIHGVAPVGFNAGILQNILILNTKNEALFPYRGGSYSGTLLVDGVVIKEESLLNGFYYLNIHTKTYPGGEIRGQIKFQ